jgi:glycosyltransferase involved in cell wall biosynthesis
VIYTAHGFHFYKGASKKNWLLFYPIERFFSRITDVLITINEEDYRLAKRKFKAKEVYRIPGIGVNEERLQLNNFDANMYRLKLGVKKEDYMVLSVGELNNNKNHSLIIKAIAEMKDASVHYFIAGVGENKEKYEKLIEELEIEGQIHLLGFRTDIAELNHCADVFAFPSIREGLGMAALEALTCGTPVCGMDTRGINEYVVNGKTGYLFSNNVEDCKNSLIKVKGKETDMRQACIEMSKNYYKEKTNDIMKLIYERNAV